MAYCENCGMAGMIVEDESSRYCQSCGFQSANYIVEAFDTDDAHLYSAAFIREKRVARNEEQQQTQYLSQDPMSFTPSVPHCNLSGPTADAGSQLGNEWHVTEQPDSKQLASVIRTSYVDGLQKILQLQCESLVKDFGVTPLICGIVGQIWLKYVAFTRVFEDVWAEEAIEVAEHRELNRKGNPRRVFQGAGVADDKEEDTGIKQKGKKRQRKPRTRKGPEELRTSFGQKCRFVWLRALKERLPLALTLGLCYLGCYVTRESILPTDIRKWASKCRLPYLTAFIDISRPAPNHIPNTVGGRQYFPFEPRLMFKPLTMVGARTVELLAGSIAERVGLQLPPVNFHALSFRFMHDLGLPVEKLSVYVHRVYEWYAPSGLWLSGREDALPTRVYVMAMLIIALKILYKLGAPTQAEPQQRTTLNKSLSSKDEDKDGHLPSQRVKGKLKVEGSEDERQGIFTETMTGAHEMGGTGTSRSKQHESIPNPSILGRRKRSLHISEQQKSKCRDMHLLEEASCLDVSGANIALPKEPWQLGDSKVLLEKLMSSPAKLRSAKKASSIDYDTKLSTYLKYCRDVVFAGYSVDGFHHEHVRDHFWDIYSKAINEVAADSEEVGRAEKYDLSPGSTVVRSTQEDGNIKEMSRVNDMPQQSRLESDNQGNGTQLTGHQGGDWSGISYPETSSRGGIRKSRPERDEDEVIHSCTLGNEEIRPEPAKDIHELDMRTPDKVSSDMYCDMKKAGFSCLPPLTDHVGIDQYMRYSFMVSDSDLRPVHADYFSVLQICGKLIKVHPRALHWCIQIVEKGLIQVEADVEKFFLGQNGQVRELAQVVKRKKFRRRNKEAEAERARSAVREREYITDLSYL